MFKEFKFIDSTGALVYSTNINFNSFSHIDTFTINDSFCMVFHLGVRSIIVNKKIMRSFTLFVNKDIVSRYSSCFEMIEKTPSITIFTSNVRFLVSQ